MQPKKDPKDLMILGDVLSVFPESKSGWYRGMRAGKYPRPVKIGKRKVAWRGQDIARLVATVSESAD